MFLNLMNNNIKIDIVGAGEDIVLLTIKGSLDTLAAYQLQEQIKTLLEQGRQKFLVDLAHLEYLSSAGIGLFSALILNQLRQHDQILFLNVPEHVEQVLRITHLIDIFPLADNLETALARLDPEFAQ